MTALEKEISFRIQQSGDFDFPSLKVQSYHRGCRILDLSIGKNYQYFDLASLTKIIFTTTYFMDAVATGKLKLTDKLQKHLPWYQHSSVKIDQLLNHSAGNHWWEPYYEKISLELDPVQSFQQLKKLCQKAPLKKEERAVYSDLDFLLLGAVMESIENRPLLSIWDRLKNRYYPSLRLHFNYKNQPTYARSSYAPTENSAWRKKILQGEVHDENAWSLGGVAPHAGLFGRIEDLAAYGNLLRHSYWGQKNTFVSSTVMKRFARRSLPVRRGDWGLGFMLPAPTQSSAGELLSKKAFGHTGFTGTALWYDPTEDLMIGMVSNRVYPTRKNQGFIRLRPKIHDWIVQHVRGEL